MQKSTNIFNVDRGVRRSDTISPKLFITLFENIFKQLDWEERGINGNGEMLNNLRFAVDLVLITGNIDKVEHMLLTLKNPSNRMELKLNYPKTNLVLSRSAWRLHLVSIVI